MTDQQAPGRKQATERTKLIRAGLRRRHLNEQIFRILGIVAICAALGFVALLFTDVMRKGIPAFHQASLHLTVTFDPAIIKVDPEPVQEAGQSDADYNAVLLKWQRNVAMLNWNKVIAAAMTEAAPAGFEISSKDILTIPETNARHVVREAFVADPSLLGQSKDFSLLASANVDNWVKGNIDRDLPDARQQLSAPVRDLVDILVDNGAITQDFAWGLFTNVDSRAAPASAGLAGAFMGSLYMMLVVICLAVPIGVASAIYLEEFAPKSRLTDLIEVNINNLAAVPSIVFGLLGAAVFINYFHLPLSAPLVGGLVLTLMTLPTIIIATRAALQAVSPALRQAALGLGASRTQMVFHHVLPVTFPSILTATIIGVAQALGETAPLLLIGMNAFVASIPGSPMDQATALPVQIFLWQGNENRNFFEARTSAAIMVLLGMMILLNAVAIFLRTRLERRA
ncbi:phosphate ABC transporter permease PstA [Devosia sp. J2-20]|uniref:phosphate ABC transporter permease PstA n=3 Tax=Devosiaceae TaxID=2831106 RepID=UPI0022AF8856|nr:MULTISPECIES: phosphate ABC transporter permease PstA [Devosia]MCZ4347021.1 phosphate ABC transporter permease PstA [Devosia neptuniae]WDQ99263.1 phosphate ABC transporter permease PstA [Devosia sp. J2-20]|tara:strand:+ start:3092 stop:4456 length:1365 start_codon:yes stop_codon:yes gene_type:complete